MVRLRVIRYLAIGLLQNVLSTKCPFDKMSIRQNGSENHRGIKS
ncbi:unnamed protein product [Meloidogyne enterolobii]|uniref:Uncharacterized protein n=1 Tax=Meloidogyne enterolobii TaxID=390850 RepID=A0ACB0Y588_MELEN